MKRILFLIFLSAICFAGFSQVQVYTSSQVDAKIDSANKAILATMNAYLKTLDTAVVTHYTTTGAVTITTDTFKISNNTSRTYYISVEAQNASNHTSAGGSKVAQVTNVNGNYVVTYFRTLDGLGYGGDASINKATWSVKVVNKLAVLTLTGVAGVTMNWTITKNNTL